MLVLRRANTGQAAQDSQPAPNPAEMGLPSLVRRAAGKMDAAPAVCGNPQCGSGRLHLWRSRQVPVFEESWTCSPRCTRALVERALMRELAGHGLGTGAHQPRMPLGLVLLARGWISRAELKGALEHQQSAGQGSIGEWLRRLYGTSSETIAKGLAAQWSCAYLRPGLAGLEPAPSLVPGILQRTHQFFPMRHAPSGVLYMVCAERVEPSVLAAIGRMLKVRVEAAFMPETDWAQTTAMAQGPSAVLHAVERGDLGAVLANAVENAKPASSSLVRVRDLLWLRTVAGKAGRGVETEPSPQDFFAYV